MTENKVLTLDGLDQEILDEYADETCAGTPDYCRCRADPPGKDVDDDPT